MDNILNHIGNTPLIFLENMSQELQIRLYAKMESMNPGRSLKDRSSKNIIMRALANKKINQDTTIVESSSGNMAIGLSRICKLLGLKLITVVDPNINQQTLKLIQLYGAQVEMVETKDPSGSYLQTRLQKVRDLLSSTPNSFTTNQYSNPDNPAAHQHIYREIKYELGFAPDYLLVAVSTCGSIKGILNEIKENGDSTKVIAVDSVGSLIFSDQAALRYIPGMGASKKPDFEIDNLIFTHSLVAEEDTVKGCYKLLQSECILAGGSTGAQVAALMQAVGTTIEKDASVCIIVADDGERYLDTIYNEDWVNEKIRA